MATIHGRMLRLGNKVLLLLIAAGFAGAQRAHAQSLLDQFLPAQEVEASGEIETDRDSVTPATTLVAPSKVLIESAYSFVDNRDAKETHSLPELVIRYGVTDWLELRFGTNYEIGGEPSDVSTGEAVFGEHVEEAGGLEEETNVTFGLKLDLTDQNYWTPNSAIILRGATPTSGESTATTFVATYVFGWELENGWAWDSAIKYGTSGEGESSTESWSPSTVVKVSVTENAKAHLEYFGIFNDSPEGSTRKHYISPGVHYLITEDFEVGVRVGWGLNHEAANFFSNVGFGWQF